MHRCANSFLVSWLRARLIYYFLQIYNVLLSFKNSLKDNPSLSISMVMWVDFWTEVIDARLILKYSLPTLDLVWFGMVILWHINHGLLFNAKSFLYVYVKYMISKYILLITFSNEPELIISTQLNDFTYFYLIQIILFTIALFFLDTIKYFQVLLFNTNKSIKPLSFVYTKLNDQTVLFQTIQFSMSTHLIKHQSFTSTQLNN